jgi:hypothetical protein
VATSAVKNLVFSFIRTIVPAGVTWLIGVVTDNFGPIIDDSNKAQLVALAYGVAFGAYYLIVRLLETYVAPRFSWFLGDFRKGLTVPVYPDAPPPPAAVVQPAADGDV